MRKLINPSLIYYIGSNLKTHSLMKYISTLTVLILLLVTACTKQDDIQVITNVNGYTLTADSLLNFTTLAIQNGKVLDVGGNEIADKYNAATKIEGKGQTMLPGLIDAHGHVMGLGFQELQVNVAGITTLEGTLGKIKEYAEEN